MALATMATAHTLTCTILAKSMLLLADVGGISVDYEHNLTQAWTHHNYDMLMHTMGNLDLSPFELAHVFPGFINGIFMLLSNVSFLACVSDIKGQMDALGDDNRRVRCLYANQTQSHQKKDCLLRDIAEEVTTKGGQLRSIRAQQVQGGNIIARDMLRKVQGRGVHFVQLRTQQPQLLKQSQRFGCRDL